METEVKKILVVFEEPMTGFQIRKALGNEYQMIIAHSAAEAVALFEKEGADMVIADMELTDMDAHALRDTLAKEYRGVLTFMIRIRPKNAEGDGWGFDLGEKSCTDYLECRVLPMTSVRKRVENLFAQADKLKELMKKKE